MSNPIASETTEPECATDGCDGTPRYCMLCHVGIHPSARSEPASDPSGKGAGEFHADTLLGIFCNGNLERIAEVCPAGIPWNGFQRIADYMDREFASLRQQLSEHEKFAREVATDLGAGSVAETSPISELRGLIFNLLHARKIDHDDLEGKVSQLEADLRINRDYFQDKVSVLTKERDELKGRQ